MRATDLDRAAAVRGALRALVAERGFHGASMNAVAAAAGVATGTAYTHYASKDDLVIAAYLETKEGLGAAAVAALDPAAEPAQRFRAMWLASYLHLAANRDHALFLLQVHSSPYRERAHEAAMARAEDPFLTAAADPSMRVLLRPLAPDVLYELGLAPAVRLAAAGVSLDKSQLKETAEGCWRAISRS